MVITIVHYFYMHTYNSNLQFDLTLYNIIYNNGFVYAEDIDQIIMEN